MLWHGTNVFVTWARKTACEWYEDSADSESRAMLSTEYDPLLSTKCTHVLVILPQATLPSPLWHPPRAKAFWCSENHSQRMLRAPRNLKNTEMALTYLVPEYLTAIYSAQFVNNCTGRGVVTAALSLWLKLTSMLRKQGNFSFHLLHIFEYILGQTALMADGGWDMTVTVRWLCSCSRV